jgi:ketosteroid isomerase-like protein
MKNCKLKMKELLIMKNLYPFLLLLLFGLNVQAQTQISTTDKQFAAFQQNVEKWKDAYNSGDAQNLVPLYSEDAIYSSSHVPGLEAIGREKLIANFQKGISMGGHIDKVEILSANVSGEMASLYCLYQATNSGVTVTGRNLLVLRKVKGEWLIFSHMTVV